MGVLQAIADVILILAALLSLIAFAFLAYSGLLIYRLVKDVKSETSLLTGEVKETMTETRQTISYVSESIVKPASLVVGYATAIRATAKALTEEVVRKSRD